MIKMNGILMSTELEGRIDEAELFGGNEDSNPIETPDCDVWIIEMSGTSVEATLLQAQWNTEGFLRQIILRLGSGSLQKILEGIKVVSMGFRPAGSQKISGVNLGHISGISHTVDVVGDDSYITVTIHPVVDT